MPTSAVPDAATLAEKVMGVLRAAAGPITYAQVKSGLKAAGVATTGKNAVTESAIRDALRAEGVHEHLPTTARGAAKYWHAPPLTPGKKVAADVRAKAALLGNEPVTAAGLGLPTRATPEQRDAFDAVVAELIRGEKLFRYGTKYGKHKPTPPPWYKSDAYKKDFAAAFKLAESKVVGLEKLIAALRQELGGEPLPPPPPLPPLPPPPITLRQSLKDAYDELCLYKEFRDKLVELRRLYPETLKRYPGLSVEQFHHELDKLNDEQQIELHVLNEVAQAKDRPLAIWRNNRLYYYARWKN